MVEIDRYCRRTGTEPTLLFNRALGSPAALYRMRRGDGVTDYTQGVLRRFMDDNPEGVKKLPCGGAAHKARRSL